MRDLASLPADLRREMAAHLGRIAGVLDRQLAELDRLGAAIDSERSARGGGERLQALLADYRGLRRQAERWRWYLYVQREAVGLTDAAEVDRLYPLPPEL